MYITIIFVIILFGRTDTCRVAITPGIYQNGYWVTLTLQIRLSYKNSRNKVIVYGFNGGFGKSNQRGC